MSVIETDQTGALLPGTIIKGYRIERELGRGAMAIVYLATQLDLGRSVALKVLTEELAGNAEFVTRFFNEAQAAAALNHPNIIQALDAGVTEEGIHFFCMEYVDGKTLLDLIKERGRIEPEQCRKWFLEIAQALNYGWELHKFTHGDLKPENIMINGQGHAKLADFGLAKVDGHDYSGNVVMLTPLYAPPEMIRGEKFVDECRPDIYAFGASLYHALAGSPPFPGTDAQLVISRQLNEPLEPLSHRNMQIPVDWSEFVGTMLVKEMGKRLGSWQAVIDGLVRLGSNRKVLTVKRTKMSALSATHSAPVRQTSRGLSWSGLLIVILMLVFLVLLGAYLFRPGGLLTSEAPENSEAPRVSAESPAEASGSGVAKAVSSPSASPSPSPSPSPSSKSVMSSVRASSATVSPAVSAASAQPMSEVRRAVPPAVKKTPARGSLRLDAVDDSELTGLPSQSEEGSQAATADDAEPESSSGSGNGGSGAAGGSKAAAKKPEVPEGMLDPASRQITLALDASQREFLAELELALLWLESTHPESSLPAVSPSQHSRLTELSQGASIQSVRKMGSFILKTVLPAYNRLPVAIAEDMDRVKTQSFEMGRESVRLVGCQLARDGYIPQVELKNAARRLVRPATWVRLHQAGILQGLSQNLLNAGKVELAKSRSYLAYCALSGRGLSLSAVLSRLPAGEERELWHRLVSYEQLRGREREESAALRGIQAVLKSARIGSWVGIGKELQHLEKLMDTRACRRVSELLAFCRDSSAARLWNLRLDTLLKEVEKSLEDEEGSGEHLSDRLLRWQAWHGRQMGKSEEKRFDRVLRRCLALIPQSARIASLPWAAGFLFDSSRSSIYQTSARVRVFGEKENFPEKLSGDKREIMALLNVSSRLEMGDWLYANQDSQRRQWSRFENKETLRTMGTDGQILFALSCYGRELLDLRFRDGQERADRHLGHLLKRIDRDSPIYLSVCNLVLESWLLSRRGGDYSGNDIAAQIFAENFASEALKTPEKEEEEEEEEEEDSRFDGPWLRRRFTYLYVSALVEGGHAKEAMSLLSEIKSRSSVARRHGFAEGLSCVDSLRHQLRGMREDESMEIGDGDADVMPEFLRAFFSCSGQIPMDEVRWYGYRKVLAAMAETCGNLGGDVIFEVVLRRVGYELSQGMINHAVEEVEWSLGLKGSCLFPYHFRLMGLRAGLLLLSGIRSGLVDGAYLAEESSVMSRAERHIFGGFGVPPEERHVTLNTSNGHHTQFWYRWLSICERVGTAAGSRDELNSIIRTCATYPNGERCLLKGLDGLLKRRTKSR